MNYFEEAKRAIRHGDAQQARSLLSQALKENPHNEGVWLLLAEVVEKDEHTIYCLEQALKLNPTNFRVVERLNKLRGISPSSSKVIPHTATRSKDAKERVIHKARIHLAMLAGPIILVLVGLIPTIAGMSSLDLRSFLCFGVPFVLLGAFATAHRILVYFTHECILTNKRIIIKTGVLSRSTFEVLLQKVEGIGMSQSLMGRLLGYGAIAVTGTGGAKQSFTGIQKPVEFQRMVQKQIETLSR